MNTSTASLINATKHAPTPLEVSAIQAPAHMCWILLGMAAALCNLIIFVTVVKMNSLHTKSQLLAASLAFADLCRSTTYCGTGLKRYLIYAFQRPEVIEPIFCALQTSPMTFFAVVSADMKLALSIDRFLAVAAPAFYYKRPLKSYVTWVNALVWTHGLVHSGVAFLGYNAKLTLSVCTALSSFNAWYTPYSSVLGVVTASATVGVYLASVFYLRRRINGMKGLGETQRKEERVKLELDVFRALVAILIGYVGTTLVGAMSYLVLPYTVTPETSVLLAPFLALSFICDCASHLFIFLVLNSAFRRALIAMMKSSSTRVQQLASSGNV